MAKETRNLDQEPAILDGAGKKVAYGTDKITPFYVDAAGTVFGYNAQHLTFKWDAARDAWLYVAG